jgi:hypothetical protein
MRAFLSSAVIGLASPAMDFNALTGFERRADAAGAADAPPPVPGPDAASKGRAPAAFNKARRESIDIL